MPSRRAVLPLVPIDEDATAVLPDDPEPMTQRERRAWYCFDWANSVYSTVAISRMSDNCHFLANRLD